MPKMTNTMKETQRIALIKWYRHYEDEILIQPYRDLETMLIEHAGKIGCVYEGELFSVYAYHPSIDAEVKAKTDDLFEPKFYLDMQDWKDQYYEYDPDTDSKDVSDADMIGQYEYDQDLDVIMKESGGDEKEFARLWCEKF